MWSKCNIKSVFIYLNSKFTIHTAQQSVPCTPAGGILKCTGTGICCMHVVVFAYTEWRKLSVHGNEW